MQKFNGRGVWSRVLEVMDHDSGCKKTITELSEMLDCSRPLVREVVIALARKGFLRSSGMKSGKGRPAEAYERTELVPLPFEARAKQHLWGLDKATPVKQKNHYTLEQLAAIYEGEYIPEPEDT